MITIVANWKMNPQTHEDADMLWNETVALAKKYPYVEIVMCPPFVFLSALRQNVQANSKIGAQDVFWSESGAYTGEVSPLMLVDSNVTHVLIGHSERRHILGETDEMINKKIHATLKHGISPVVLIGERDKDDIREDMLIDQIAQTFAGISGDDFKKILVCYEPAWAINSSVDGKAATPEYVASGIALMQDIFRKNFGLTDDTMPTFLYGGSVDADHGRAFLEGGNVSGFVIGSASINSEKFEKLLVSLS